MSDEWKGLLDDDEKVIWQGRPSPRIKLAWQSTLDGLTSLFIIGFSIFWMVGASQAGGYFWMFGLLIFAVGLYKAVLIHFWKALERKATHYTLTNKRAFIALDGVNGKVLDSYPINADTTLTLKDGALTTIHFAEKSGQNGRTSFTTPVGLEYIAEGRAVYQLLRKVQAGSA